MHCEKTKPVRDHKATHFLVNEVLQFLHASFMSACNELLVTLYLPNESGGEHNGTRPQLACGALMQIAAAQKIDRYLSIQPLRHSWEIQVDERAPQRIVGIKVVPFK
jgi:hypothetical protein